MVIQGYITAAAVANYVVRGPRIGYCGTEQIHVHDASPAIESMKF